MKTLYQLLQVCSEKLNSLNSIILPNECGKRLDEIDNTVANAKIWDDPRKAASLMRERKEIVEKLENMKSFNERFKFYDEFYKECPDEGENLLSEVEKLFSEIETFELQMMFDNDVDGNDAILSINAGAGGTESKNFASMLYRMYVRWADRNGFKTEILDEQYSDEYSDICIDSASIRIVGKNAYGFIKGESGVHRLIRNSPFNSGDARHTSFAAVSVVPDIEEQKDIVIDEKDLEISRFARSSGPGGQNSNKVSSCVRIKHIPTTITVTCNSERDQHANLKIGMKILKAKLWKIEEEKRQSEEDKRLGKEMEIKFGSQVRTYTLTPYQLVKDHRTDFENRNAEAVLDGDIDGYLFAYLKHFLPK